MRMNSARGWAQTRRCHQRQPFSGPHFRNPLWEPTPAAPNQGTATYVQAAKPGAETRAGRPALAARNLLEEGLQ
jgi:hypothetical protein